MKLLSERIKYRRWFISVWWFWLQRTYHVCDRSASPCSWAELSICWQLKKLHKYLLSEHHVTVVVFPRLQLDITLIILIYGASWEHEQMVWNVNRRRVEGEKVVIGQTVRQKGNIRKEGRIRYFWQTKEPIMRYENKSSEKNKRKSEHNKERKTMNRGVTDGKASRRYEIA